MSNKYNNSSLIIINNEINKIMTETVSTLQDLGISDYFEIMSNFYSEITDAIGPLKAVKAVYSMTTALKAKRDMKNIKIFIEKLKAGNISKIDIDKYARKNLKTSKDIQAEIEKVLLLLSSFFQEEKSHILVNLYVNLIRGNITYFEFETYVSILNNLILSDIITLKELIEKIPLYSEEYKKYHSVARLNALGLLSDKGAFLPSRNSPRFFIFEDGKKFYKFGIKDVE